VADKMIVIFGTLDKMSRNLHRAGKATKIKKYYLQNGFVMFTGLVSSSVETQRDLSRLKVI
jgi:hypothetical protein